MEKTHAMPDARNAATAALQFHCHRKADETALGALLDLCFGADRHLRTASLVRATASRIDAASFIATTGGQLVGSVECWHIVWQARAEKRPMALLGPLAAHPDWRRLHIGGQLMDKALGVLDRLQLPVMLIGDEPYYRRWGFGATHTRQWTLPGPVNPERLLLRCRNGAAFDAPANIQGAASAPSTPGA